MKLKYCYLNNFGDNRKIENFYYKQLAKTLQYVIMIYWTKIVLCVFYTHMNCL